MAAKIDQSFVARILPNAWS